MKKPEKARIITKTILLVSLVSLFTDISSEMLYPVMPVYLKSIGFSVLLIGILEGFAEATAGLSKGYFGQLSDSKGKRLPFVQAGYMLSAVSKPMLALFINPLWIFSARAMDRLGKGIRTGARDAILSDETIPENKARVFGFHRGMDTFGAALGPIVALVYLYFNPGAYRALFLIAFIPALVGIIFTFLVKEKQNKTLSQNAKNPGFFSYISYWKKASSEYKKLVIGLLVFTLINSSDAFLLLMMKNQGLSDQALILVYIFYNLVFAAFAYPIGILADKLGLKISFIFGLLLFSFVYLAMPYANGFYFFGIIFFAYGLYAASTEGISKAWITNLSLKQDTATAIGFYTSFASIFTMIASALGGLLWQFWGPQALFLFSGSGALLLVVYFLFIKIKFR